ncbi:MAG: metallophosphoesterase [Deltaproteobacteria bacterium]|nr:metallophosphoesterase [Deltaproteobacteria bacterium]
MTTVTLDDGLVLLAPGGVFAPDLSLLVVADLHGGTVPTLRHRGYALPDAGDEALHEKLRALLAETDPRTVAVAGDLIHGRGATLARGGESALSALLALFEGRSLVVVPGNHDGAAAPWLERPGVTVTERYALGPHVVLHGDEDPPALKALRDACLARGGRVLAGHLHPALTLQGGGARRRVPAFAWAPGWLSLPALSPWARGAELRSRQHARPLEAVVPAEELSLAVVLARGVVPVGTLARVRQA